MLLSIRRMRTVHLAKPGSRLQVVAVNQQWAGARHDLATLSRLPRASEGILFCAGHPGKLVREYYPAPGTDGPANGSYACKPNDHR